MFIGVIELNSTQVYTGLQKVFEIRLISQRLEITKRRGLEHRLSSKLWLPYGVEEDH